MASEIGLLAGWVIVSLNALKLEALRRYRLMDGRALYQSSSGAGSLSPATRFLASDRSASTTSIR